MAFSFRRSRRRVIFVGVAGAVALATAAVVTRMKSTPAPKGPVLMASHDTMLRSIATALLGSALPGDAPARAAELARVLAAIAALVDNLPPLTRSEVGDLLGLLSFKPARAALGYGGDWVAADTPQIVTFLYGLRDSSIELKQQIYFALHDLVMGTFYAEPSTWPATGYPGPPKLA
ncbi:MAG: hypothetical protein EAZ43_09855 [Betaproteobacteria bacterium]|nr:MAG: hypothetical protein EAZ43_09855 [Betaproteobacteria bacterium]